MEEEAESLSEPEEVDDTKEVVSSRHSRMDAHMTNRDCDRQPARGLHRFKAFRAPVLTWEVGTRAPSTNQEAISN